jgi:hypothetical protein
MSITISEAVRTMLDVVDRMKAAYDGKRRFTLDGRLVGDIGEILAECAYDLVLDDTSRKHYDGVDEDGRLVQIKATMKASLTFPAHHVPNCYLGILIHPDGTFEEIFNGPGHIIKEAVKNRSSQGIILHSIPIGALRKLQEQVRPGEEIRGRQPAIVPARISDEAIAAEPLLPPPVLPADAVPRPLEAFLPRARKPVAVAGVVENGLVRPLDPTVRLPEHARVVIIANEAV